MSRCFPYPPPGYTPSRASNEALIESIKLQREREKAKAERKKERKRDKKEKKKAKEEKAKQIKNNHLDQDAYQGETLGYVKGEIHQKERKDDTEQLERSSITEEHEQPISSQNPSYSSDSTQNSGKIKRHASHLNGTRIQGNILRIRLPSQKRIKHDIRDGEEQLICLPSEKHVKSDIIRGGDVQQCSTSGRTDVPVEHNNNVTGADADKSHPTSKAAELIHDHPLRSFQDLSQPNTVEQHDDTCYLENVHTDTSSKRHRKLKRVAQRYRDLIENWTPPSMLSEPADNDDDDWLFGSKDELNRPEKKLRVGTELTCSSSSTLWPRAHYLPDADIYALPYAIPF